MADPLQTLQAALTAPANTQEQANLLAVLRDSLEAQPARIPILVQTLINNSVNAPDSLLKRWVIDLFHFGICRSSLNLEQRTQMAVKSLDTLIQLFDDPTPDIVKVVIQCMTAVYPLVFRHLCSNRANALSWTSISNCKTRIIQLVWAPIVNAGIRAAAVKFLQRVILVQTRGVSDPRLQNKNDPNLSFCPADHPFIHAQTLDAEGQRLLDGVAGLLFSSKDPDLLSALLNSWIGLVKNRPATLQYVIGVLRQWTPAALVGLSYSNIKSVEKGVRILLTHISKLALSTQYSGQIAEYLNQQAIRMDKANQEEKRRKAESRKRPATVDQEAPDNKRPKLETEGQPRPASSAHALSSFDFTSLPAALITNLIVANLEAFTEGELLTLVNAYRESRHMPIPGAAPTIPHAETSQIPGLASSSTIPTGPRAAMAPSSSGAPQPPEASTPVVKEEPVDPLKMDVDEEDVEYEPDRLNEELADAPEPEDDAMLTDVLLPGSTILDSADFKVPPPKELSEDVRNQLMTESLTRIWDGSEQLRTFGEGDATTGTQLASEMWMLLIVRMITRVAEPPPEWDDEGEEEGRELAENNFYMRQDRLRQTLCNYIMADFPARVRLGTTWMNEEWYNDQIRLQKNRDWRPNYETWLNQIVASYQTILDGKDKSFARFLLDLPSVPGEVLDLLRDLCLDSASTDRMQVGFTTLRSLVIQRPSLRIDSLNVLLELTTHPEKRTRMAAINSVKNWVPHSQPMDGMIREFALQMLRKLQRPPSSSSTSSADANANGTQHAQAEPAEGGDVKMNGVETANGNGNGAAVHGTPEALPEKEKEQEMEDGEEEEDGQLPPEEVLQTPYLPDRIELPAQKSQVLQHVELLFALSVKVPEFLDQIFKAYGQMDESVQAAVQDLISPLIRSLGSSHGKLLTLMRQCPAGAESLTLRVLTIFTEHGRPSGQLVALVKALINEKNLDARFLIPIIAEMDKADIIRYLPRIVSSLNGQSEPKNLVRSVFSSIVTTPPQTFGSVTSNLPRVRQSELLTPAELMVLLHESEKEIGLKSAIEAIGICFSMTDVFRSEILAVVMQQIMDEPTLPVLFLRTVIQAVTTYKSLVGFVSTTLLSRLITKKIWTNPPLWEGFIRCAKVIAPASFGALLQLPKDQLRELVDKQPSLKSGLRDYVTKKAPNKARGSAFLDIFGEPDDSAATTPRSSTPQPAEAAAATPPTAAS